MPQELTIDTAAIDYVMGAGWYKKCLAVLEERVLHEQDRAVTNLGRLSGFWNSTTASQLERDLDYLNNAYDALGANILDIQSLANRDLLSASAAALKQGLIERIYNVCVSALSLMTIENWILDDLYSYRVMSLISTISMTQVREAAAAAFKSLTAIETELKLAQRLKAQSMNQLKINALLAVITPLILPAGAITVLAAPLIGFGQIVMDDLMGVSTSWSANWGSRAATGAGAHASSLGEIMKAEGKHTKAANVAKVGKGIALLGIAFDVNEVMVASNSESIVRRKFEVAVAEWNTLADKADDCQMKFTEIQTAVRLGREQYRKRGLPDLQTARTELASEIIANGYNPLKS